MSDSEKYLFSIAEGIQRREAELGFEALSQKEKVFIAIWGLEADVNNGGLEQYFGNSTADHCREAVEALRAVGAHKTAPLLERAMAAFGSTGPSTDWEIRQAQVDDLSESALDALQSLDEEFLRYEDNLSELLSKYMHSH